MSNRGTIKTETIADKLKKVEQELGIEQLGEEKNLLHPPLVFINGRLDRKQYTYVAKNFSLLDSLNSEIKKVCKGVDLTILNYLIHRGLLSIKNNEELEYIEYSEFEAKIAQTYKS